MTPDDVIDLRRLWTQYDFGDEERHPIPVATILATSDWLAYVTAMADTIPDGPTIEFPSEEEVRWAWPDGVVVVLDYPVMAEHLVISHTDRATNTVVEDEPHYDTQPLRAIVIGPVVDVQPTGPGGAIPVYPDGTRVTMRARGVRYIDDGDPGAYYGGWMSFGGGRQAAGNLDHIGGVGRLLLAVVNALGHRLTTLSAPSGLDRHAAKRLARSKFSELRVLELTHGATTQSRGGTVEWSHRWMVRGHWRDQPCGPGRASRRLTWIDPYIKGPADKPLDIRPTIWKADEL